jgi:hypothetical protein
VRVFKTRVLGRIRVFGPKWEEVAGEDCVMKPVRCTKYNLGAQVSEEDLRNAYNILG